MNIESQLSIDYAENSIVQRLIEYKEPMHIHRVKFLRMYVLRYLFDWSY